MFSNDSEELREAVVKALKSFGIKPRLKREGNRRKQNGDIKGISNNSAVFKISLDQLPGTEVCLDCGAYVSVPTIIVQFCDRIRLDIQVEGIFRKNGSQSRQHDIKVFLEKGSSVSSTHHVIDVAVLLKEFLRCLPTPLIPYQYHDEFLKCLALKDKSLEAILLLCFLLPSTHLHLLAYLMQFFSQVDAHSNQNKMTAHNLSLIITPNIMPSTSRNTFMCSNAIARTENCRRIIEDLIVNASSIGVVPDNLLISSNPQSEANAPGDYPDIPHKRRRRSASLTRMFNGFKRMVAKTNPNEENILSTPDTDLQPYPHTPVPAIIINTPTNSVSAKKRKSNHETHSAMGFSAKKRRELMKEFAQQGITLLSPKIIVVPGCNEKDLLNANVQVPSKKKFFSSHSATNLKKSTTSLKEKARKSFSGTGLKISRLKLRKSKSKEKGLDTTDENELTSQHSEPESEHRDLDLRMIDYVRVPKHEFEMIQQRVAQIETRISAEFGRSVDLSDEEKSNSRKRESIEHVEQEYAKTLDKVEHLNSTCDNLADQLKRDLKIRRSGDNRVMRSPSARKIGSIRRRSKDRSNTVARHHSLNIHDKPLSYKMDRNRSIRRTKRNTGTNGLATQSPEETKLGGIQKGRITRQTAPRRAKSLLLNKKQSPCLETKPINWRPAESYISKALPHLNETRRASIAKLKEQNAGMVLAKAKLFDHFADGSEKLKNEPDHLADEDVMKRYQLKRDTRPRNLYTESINALGRNSLSSATFGRTSFGVEVNRGRQSLGFSVSGTKEPFDSKSIPTEKDDVTDKENLLSQPTLSETLENIIYDTCKVRTTPSMPVIKKPLTQNRHISFRQPREKGNTPVPMKPCGQFTPRRSPRLSGVKSKYLA